MPKPSQSKPPGADAPTLSTLNSRSREIFRQIVDSYLTTGEPVGSRHLSRVLPMTLSPASVRNVMQDLEEVGLIYAPHTSAGRLPTELGLRFFVDAMLELGDVSAEDRSQIEAQVKAASRGQTFENVLTEATSLLSDLTRGACVVVTSKDNARLKQIEFVRLDPERALAILVAEDGGVENRLLHIPRDVPPSALVEAANFLNARIKGRNLAQLRDEVVASRQRAEQELDALAARLIDAGLAAWSGQDSAAQQLIVRGQANLLDDLKAAEDLERIRLLFADLETKTGVIDLLSRAETGEGVRIFIGSENKLFSLSGSSMIAAPFRDESSQKVIGALGVIGPTRLNYARIVPMVDYTARVISKVLERG
ncbi:MAG: heat-inducible transcriptional repressor HrcA [Beijerinckiaceae bacterium]